MITGIQGLSFFAPSFGTSKKEISGDHLVIIQKLISLGIIPTYNYERDLDKLTEALGAMIEGEGQQAQSEEGAEEGLVDISPTDYSSGMMNNYVAFSSEMNQSALLNKFLFGL